MQIHTRFHEPRATRVAHTTTRSSFVYRALTVYGPTFQKARLPQHDKQLAPTATRHVLPQPRMRNARQLSHTPGLAIIRFRSPLLTEYLFLRVLRCFTSPRYPPHPIHSGAGNHTQHAARFPHSDTLGSQLVCQLPEAYRRLQRPSSAPSAKASTERPYKLTQQKIHTKKIAQTKDARVHYTVTKQPPHHTPTSQQTSQRAGSHQGCLPQNPTACRSCSPALHQRAIGRHPATTNPRQGPHLAPQHNTAEQTRTWNLASRKKNSLERR